VEDDHPFVLVLAVVDGTVEPSTQDLVDDDTREVGQADDLFPAGRCRGRRGQPTEDVGHPPTLVPSRQPLTWSGVGCLVAVFLVVALIFAGFGFVVHVLWIVAAVFFVFWLAGFAFGRGQRRARRGR